MSARVAEPGNADALADPVIANVRSDRVDNADDFMSGNNRMLWIWKIAVDHVQIRPADGARFDTNADLAFTRKRIGPLLKGKRLPDGSEDHGFHA